MTYIKVSITDGLHKLQVSLAGSTAVIVITEKLLDILITCIKHPVGLTSHGCNSEVIYGLADAS